MLAPLYLALKKHGGFCPVPVVMEAGETSLLPEALATRFDIGSVGYRTLLSGSSDTERSAFALTETERILLAESPDLVIAFGSDDVAMAGGVVAAKLGFPVASADAGLRSYDRREPWEINRMVIDTVADLHFVSEHSGEYNLINEGISDERLFFAGNLLIDSLVALMPEVNGTDVTSEYGVVPKEFVLALFNRSVSHTGRADLEMLPPLLREMSVLTTLLVSYSPGIETSMKREGLYETFRGIPGVHMIGEQEHMALLCLLKNASLLLTDTDEFQSEATVMDTPCLTLSESCARPATIEIGTNVLVGENPEEILGRFHAMIEAGAHAGRSKIPEKWDGAAAVRIVEALDRVL